MASSISRKSIVGGDQLRLNDYLRPARPTKWSLIQPFTPLLSISSQCPLRFVISSRVPLGALPTTLLLADGADLMFTPERSKETNSRGVSLGRRGALFV